MGFSALRHDWLVVALMLVLMAANAGSVAAHSRIKSAVPADKATVNAAPTQVALVLTEETNPTKSVGSVTDVGGATVSTGFRVDSADRTKMTIDLKPNLPNGAYTVAWNTFTDNDNGSANGTLTFTVQAPQPVATGGIRWGVLVAVGAVPLVVGGGFAYVRRGRRV